MTGARRRVLEAVRNGAQHAADIFDLAGLDQLVGEMAVRRLLADGLIREYGRLDWPTYELTRAGWTELARQPEVPGGR